MSSSDQPLNDAARGGQLRAELRTEYKPVTPTPDGPTQQLLVVSEAGPTWP
jgi:hypothetical protein